MSVPTATIAGRNCYDAIGAMQRLPYRDNDASPEAPGQGRQDGRACEETRS